MTSVAVADSHVVTATSQVDERAAVELEMGTLFHRLLETDRQTPEFAELWARFDAYVSARVEQEREGH